MKTTMKTNQVILITGGTRGIGLATASRLAAAGNTVYATVRKTSSQQALLAEAERYPDRFFIKTLDVTEEASCCDVVQDILQAQKQIDVLINNAGYGLIGTAESCTIAEAKAQFDVNFFGVLRMMHAVLPAMRQTKSGHIINISSTAGLRPLPFIELYAASKFALEAISVASAVNLAPWNIRVTLVEPGPVNTGFPEASMRGSHLRCSEDPYKPYIDRGEAFLAENLRNGQDPNEIASLIQSIIAENNPHMRYQTSERGHDVAKRWIVDTTGDQNVLEFQEVVESLNSTTLH